MKQRNCRGRSAETMRVMRHLAGSKRNETKVTDPILEKLRQCPEAFKVGEILGKAFDSLKYAQNDGAAVERYLPPSGTIIPPLV